MNHGAELIFSFASAAATSLASATLAGLLVLIAAIVGLRLLPNLRPANRFIVLAVVLLVSIGLHFIPFASRTASQGLQSASDTAVHLNPRWALVIVALWCAIAIFRLFRVIQSAIAVRAISRRSKLVKSDAFDAILQHGGRKVALCTSDQIERPSVVGFFRPRVLIPAAIYSSLSSVELTQILMHEVGHIRRYDDWSNLFQKITLAVFPLNPAIAWVERRLCVERELACDDCVLNAGSARKQYATCLTNLAEYSILRRNLSLTLGAWGRRSELNMRVHRILNQPNYTIGRWSGYGLTALLAGGLFVGGGLLSRIPALVSFSADRPVASATAISPDIAGIRVEQQAHDSQAAPMLVKAVMPQPQKNQSFTPHRAVRRTKSLRSDRRHHDIAPQNLIMRTEFSEQLALPRMVLTVDKATGSSYAAVPVWNGWLVIQL